MAKKIIPIKYTNRDFSSIRSSLIEHAKRYYPNTYKDFNEASFGSLMIDTVAYVGDVLSFYLDYQANESFLETAAEYKNVLKLSRTLGFKFNKSPSSYGVCQFFVLVPVVPNTGSPDMRYAPILHSGTRLTSTDDASFTLIEDVNFNDIENKVLVAKVDENTGAPTYFALKAEAQVVSGETFETTEDVEDFKRFLEVEIPGENVAEIVSVIDAEGHEYHEVEHLSQNVIFKSVVNRNAPNDSVPSILKKVAVPRRFTLEHLDDTAFLQFGYGSESEITSGSIADPADVVMRRHGRDYISDTTFDPVKLTSTDKFGVAPGNTILSIVYRSNTAENTNAASRTITKISDPTIEFTNLTLLDDGVMNYVASSLEVTNEEPIVGDISLPSVEEIKLRALGNFAAQNRAVTKEDYISMTYSMPAKFGAIKRCTILRDDDAFKRNLNLYVISENRQGYLVRANKTIKDNLKTWLNNARMINDTVDILDTYIINIGINFEVILDVNANRFEILQMATRAIEDTFKIQKDIGEPIVISDYFKVLKDIDDIVDVIDIKIVNKIGAPYSEIVFNIDRNTTVDGRAIIPPITHIFELKYPNLDIKGTVK